MKIAMLVLAIALSSSALSDVKCPIHDFAICSWTGQTKYLNGHAFRLYHCTCDDDYWVRAD